MGRWLHELRSEIESVHLTEEEFQSILKDTRVKMLLEDLDVDICDQGALFDMFDPEGNGLVHVGNFIRTIIRVRGAPQKADTVASWIAIRALNAKFQEFELVSLKNQRRLMDIVNVLQDSVQRDHSGQHSGQHLESECAQANEA